MNEEMGSWQRKAPQAPNVQRPTPTRLFLFALPAILISRAPGFEIRHVWYLSVASQVLQMCINLLLLRRELRKRLTFEGIEDLVPGGATAS